MENKKIEKSIFADRGSSITNANNTQIKFHTKSGIIGFISGIITSLIASYIWERFFN